MKTYKKCKKSIAELRAKFGDIDWKYYKSSKKQNMYNRVIRECFLGK